ncbi:hypothetical protein TRFO_18722 [Tritrichomonas foetus]|uniref:Uncharacterized protein n=1 Tax=Tritrichomonas foetus TaxID=1144522 RepID=A0A1J4KKB7_9EUKA|nr:hypothetical protein TRFO_18722 [Tritrichomonas foetus]|eukprot:OHT11743.1 hypothetical protein TRFO_18722 [Tritrichomonas foetus]
MEEIQLFEGVTIRDEPEEEEKQQEIHEETDNTDYEAIAQKQKTDYLAHLRSLKRSIEEARATCKIVKTKIDATESSVDGVSLLQVKNHCFAEYLENIAQLAVSRTCGEPVGGPIDSLVSNRCVLEKIRPLEHQMKYQLQKYSEMEKSSTTANLRANPASMLKSGRSANFENDENMVSANYMPPQVMSSLYPQAHEDQVKEAKYARSVKAHSKQSVLMDEVAAQIRDEPLEAGMRASQNRKVNEFLKRMKEIEEIEEETMQRIPRSKKDRQMLKQLEQAQGSLNTILDFGKAPRDKKKKGDKKGDKKGRKH